MERTKYNVGADKAQRSCDGIVFDSELEMRYYRDVLRPKVESGEVVHYELQKKYELQQGFSRNGKRVKPIVYVADFYIEYADGRTEVIDIKGYPDAKAKLKQKMFYFRYPDTDYFWVTHSKKWGGWLEYDTVKKLRAEEKRRIKNEKESAANG